MPRSLSESLNASPSPSRPPLTTRQRSTPHLQRSFSAQNTHLAGNESRQSDRDDSSEDASDEARERDNLLASPLHVPLTPRRLVRVRRPGLLVLLCVVAGMALLLMMAGAAGRSRGPKRGNDVPEQVAGDAGADYFAHFEGRQECGLSSTQLYTSPYLTNPPSTPKHSLFCSTRQHMLEAMSGGGRHGFNAPFGPAGCHYRWYSTFEICMILDRFDGVVFIGDDMLKAVYAGFNMLLRENLTLGGLKQWELEDESARDSCKCDGQLIKADCFKQVLESSEEVKTSDEKGGYRSPYSCDRTPHFFIPINNSPASDTAHDRLSTLLARNPDAYKPIPIIHALGLGSSLSWTSATSSMDEWLSLADSTGRNIPYLWIGPNAAGHLKPPAQILATGNNALWHYTVEMAKEASARELDCLGMYNLTMQAESWDGTGYGLRVALVQAMMVVNWLARVEST